MLRVGAMRGGGAALLFALSACGGSDGAERVEAEEIVALNGTDLYVQRVGTGDPVIVIHGGPLLEHGYLEPHLAPLADDYELVFYDQRLSGRSAAEVDSASVSVATFVEDIEALRSHIGAERVHLLGHSWGGYLALRYALAHGGHLASLILVSPMPPSTALWQQEEAELAERITPELRAAMTELRSSPAIQAREPDAVRRLLRLSFTTQFHDPTNMTALTLTVPDRYADRSRQFGYLMGDLMAFDLVPDLARISVPTLIIFGMDEPGLRVSGQVLTQGIPEADLIVLPGAGHFAFVEQPDRFLDAVRTFLSAQ